MSVEKAIRAKLLTGSATGYIGTATARLYPAIAPQGAAMPFGVYQRIATDYLEAVNGPQAEARALVQVTWYDDNYSDVHDLADAARASLHGWAGTTASITIRRIYLESERDMFEDPESGGQTGVHGVAQDYVVWHDT